MSADSPKKISENSAFGRIVLPHPTEDKSIIDSFTGFIQEVVPQACSSGLIGDNKEKILWAHFEYTDINDPVFYTDTWETVSSSTPPILLVLGYGCGVQIWHITSNGEAKEAFSWSQSVVKTLKLIPSPQLNGKNAKDLFIHKRPLIALCDSVSLTSQFCSVNFVSLLRGDLVKSIKFKNPILDILVNRISVVVTFLEKIAVFDALTLENNHTITTCYAIPNSNLNPVALSTRWLAYSDQRLIAWKKSQGGCETECSQSYTATMISAAKTLGMGLRELSGSVANSLSNLSTSPNSTAFSSAFTSTNTYYSSDSNQAGVVTVIDILSNINEDEDDQKESIIAHFVAHVEPIASLCFDPSGLLLFTADKSGRRFNIFKIQPHLLGSAYSTVHHLYVLCRGDTTARIQDVTFSIDSRWVAVTSMRGTSHVFPITPYGGPVGLRTHSTPHVVNKLSRFHRSAGISSDDRSSPAFLDSSPFSSSPTSTSYLTSCSPTFSHPTVLNALAQIRSMQVIPSKHPSSQGQEDTSPINMVACFSPPRSVNDGSPEALSPTLRKWKNSSDSLFIVSSHGLLVQYNLHPRAASGVPKDKQCDETLIELKVESKFQWYLLHPPIPTSLSSVIEPPVGKGNPLLVTYSAFRQQLMTVANSELKVFNLNDDERWLSQVEITTHIGPHRRIWMGPQFTFKPRRSSSSSESGDASNNMCYTAQSNPVNVPGRSMKLSKNMQSLGPVFIESGSCSSLEQSPHLFEAFGAGDSDSSGGDTDESKIKEDLADAMMESPQIRTEDDSAVTLFSPSVLLSEVEMCESYDQKLSIKKGRKTKKKRK